MKRNISFILALLLIALFAVTGCSGANTATPTPVATTQATPETQATATPEAEVPFADKPLVKVAGLKGPTGMGMVSLMQENEDEQSDNRYEFTLASAPEEIVGLITTGGADIAAVPTNLAATLYKKTNGGVQLAALNTLGTLYVLEIGNTINSIADLKGKEIYSSGQGSTPEYALNYILNKNSIDPEKDLTVTYKSEHSELATLMIAGDVKLAVVPEPFVTSIMAKKADVRIALNLTDEWNKVEQNATLSMGCIIVRKEFAEQNKELLDKFLAEYKTSVDYINANIEAASKLVEKFGIMASAELAAKSIPNCNIVYIDGDEMKTKTDAFYDVLYEANPASIGGAKPDEAFYYAK
jgi:NitT/TauT family transport system substrate-binding protein